MEPFRRPAEDMDPNPGSAAATVVLVPTASATVAPAQAASSAYATVALAPAASSTSATVAVAGTATVASSTVAPTGPNFDFIEFDSVSSIDGLSSDETGSDEQWMNHGRSQAAPDNQDEHMYLLQLSVAKQTQY